MRGFGKSLSSAPVSDADVGSACPQGVRLQEYSMSDILSIPLQMILAGAAFSAASSSRPHDDVRANEVSILER